MLRTIFQSLFEHTKITTKFPKRHISNISCIGINTLLGFINNKGLGISKGLKDKGFQSQTKPYYT